MTTSLERTGKARLHMAVARTGAVIESDNLRGVDSVQRQRLRQLLDEVGRRAGEIAKADPMGAWTMSTQIDLHTDAVADTHEEMTTERTQEAKDAHDFVVAACKQAYLARETLVE